MTTRAIVCLCLLATACGGPPGEVKDAVEPVVSVQVARASQEDVQLSVQSPATIYPRAQAAIASKITAPIRTVRVRQGDRVAAGQLLVELDDRDIAAQRVEALERARGDVTSTTASLDQAQKDYDRRKSLFDEGAIPERDLLASEAALARARASHTVALDMLQLLEREPEATDHDRASLLTRQLEFTRIRSPFAGVITQQLAYPGDMAKPDVPLFRVVDLSIAVARAQVPAFEIADVAVDQACRFESPDHPDRTADGQVSVVSAAVDPARRTVEVWCEIPNADGAVRAGEFGTTTIVTATVPGATVVPRSAVELEEGRLRGHVSIVGPDGHANQTDIEAGAILGDRVWIKSGVEAGDLVVTEGAYGLPDGTAVQWPGAPAR